MCRKRTYQSSHPEARIYRDKAIEHRLLIESILGGKSRASGDFAVGLAAAAVTQGDDELPSVEKIFETIGRKRKRSNEDVGNTPRSRRRRGEDTSGALVKEGLDNVASSMLQAELLARKDGQDFKKALKILNQAFLSQLSETAVMRVVDTWAKNDRLATAFIGLNDSFRLTWLKRFEERAKQFGSPDGPASYLEAALDANGDVGVRRADDYNPEDDTVTESGSDEGH
ncbi:hypothetical protein F4804DRAFT_337157 [Jackrogersella minutella]|nr:hypothetical protein F4804DRAFT_337157 [Jackrogersella minutella]